MIILSRYLQILFAEDALYAPISFSGRFCQVIHIKGQSAGFRYYTIVPGLSDFSIKEGGLKRKFNGTEGLIDEVIGAVSGRVFGYC